MDIKEAIEKIHISLDEEEAIKRYLGYEHTRINILGNFTPENYDSLSKTGWYLQEKGKDIIETINDFVKVYSAMYKNSKENSAMYRTLVRGTSNKNVNDIRNTIKNFISTSKDVNIAKTFAKYGDAALIYFDVDKNVPFLDAEKYREENRASEEEVIFAPFCKVSNKRYIREIDGYTQYSVSLEKDNLKEVSKEELDTILEEVVSGFSRKYKGYRRIYSIKRYARNAKSKNEKSCR